MTAAELAYRASVAETGDQDDLVMQELSQVYYIACRIRERLPEHVELDDLVSAGVIGLIEACRSFDPAKNVQLKTFAKFRIRGAILDSLRESDWGSRSMRRRGREIAEASQRLEAKLGRHPSEGEIAAEMQMDPERLRKILADLNGLHVAGQQITTSADGAETLDVIESAPNLEDPDPFELCLQSEMRSHLAAAIAELSEREQLILSLYYREELTMKEVAEIVGVAISRVSQIIAAAIQKLRASLEHLQERPSLRTAETPTAETGAHSVPTK
jgi:RNA polymerase sigma factor for flagellar operon FliA